MNGLQCKATKALFSNASEEKVPVFVGDGVLRVPAADAGLIIQGHLRSGAGAPTNAGRA